LGILFRKQKYLAKKNLRKEVVFFDFTDYF